MNSEETALAGVAVATMRACLEETVALGGPITNRLHERDLRVIPGGEALLEYFFWDGVRSGLKAAHDPNFLAMLVRDGIETFRD